jgi:hypothetical protein
MPSGWYLTQDMMIILNRSVLPHDEKGNLELELVQQIQHSRYEQRQIGRKRLPAFIAMGLHVRPLVIEIE